MIQPRHRSPFPCGCTRREFFWEAGAGFTALALTYLLERDGFFASKAALAAEAPGDDISSPLRPRAPHFAPRAKRCIFLFMYGGPSQLETFDPKPELVKRDGQKHRYETRKNKWNEGTILAPKRQFKRCGRSGLDISDLFPSLQGVADELAVIRSMVADSFAHGSAILQMNTGSIFTGKPSLGSWLGYGLGTPNQNLPAFVVMLDPRGGPISGPPNWSAGYMPAAFQGTYLRATGAPIVDLEPPAGRTRAMEEDTLAVLAKLNRRHREGREKESELAARIASYELAYRMQTAAPEAVDISREPEETKKLYGLDDPRSADFGRKCLLARRLVERGVRFIQIYSGGGHNDENWDAHGDVQKNHELHAGETDKPIAGLIADLKSRGLLDETLIIWGGEFGRQPIAQNGKGRDHNPLGFSMWLAGGGVRGGTVLGATDELGGIASEDKVHVHDLHATVLHLLGLDHTRLTYFYGGRNQRLTDVHGRVVTEILA